MNNRTELSVEAQSLLEDALTYLCENDSETYANALDVKRQMESMGHEEHLPLRAVLFRLDDLAETGAISKIDIPFSSGISHRYRPLRL